ncbi:cation-translocating P-type ATPase [Paludibacter sp. 221]|uniref:heavy metal translocating P-type ATPase n=1 Tax=Paludibacter sp. 221 TaxID=2302939 RepID=UPI0013D3DD87|nr:heavy metal translocating P-type ATPase [Paludibacter sp. 221]
MVKKQFDITGMSCSACSAHVEKSVAKLDGVQSVSVNLLTNSMAVEFDEKTTNETNIEQTVAEAGYQAHVQKADNTKSAIDFVQKEQEEMRRRWWWSLVFLIPLLYVAMGHMFSWPLPAILLGNENALTFSIVQLALIIPIAVLNLKYFTRGFKSMIKGNPNMDSLVALGASAAIIYGVYAIFRIAYGLSHNDMEMVQQFSHDLYFESAGTILTLVTLGKYFESKSKSKTSEAITKLMDLAPKTATIIRYNIEKEVPIEQVLVGDLVIVKPGQRIPVDGVIEKGTASVDESALTGESIPVFKQAGDTVLTATINKTGSFTFKATKVGSDTTLSQIIALVNEASASKAPISKLADKISSVFVPIVICIAVIATIIWLLLGYSFDFALSIGISVLVISCPCALGLATPVAIMVGTGKGAEHGILIKSAESFEKAQKIDTVVLDKTGTITEGRPHVTDIYTNGISNGEFISLLASLEKLSEHPLAEAIEREAARMKVELLDTDNFNVIPGLGIEGTIKGTYYCVGSRKLLALRNIDISNFQNIAEQLAEEGKTPLFLANSHDALGLVAVADIVKPSSKKAIEQMYGLGMDVVMLTGDNKKTAQAIQKQLNIKHVVAEVLPQDKDREIIRLQSEKKTVAMVGDGINDAPALMRSNLGMAIGGGTDIAIESADIVLMRSDLLDAVTAFRLSNAVLKNIKQNLFWAFIYNIICIPLAAGVFFPILGWKLSPMFAALAMSFSSVSVVLNALRLRNFKPLSKNAKYETKNRKSGDA